jgi:hypothetical protein
MLQKVWNPMSHAWNSRQKKGKQKAGIPIPYIEGVHYFQE